MLCNIALHVLQLKSNLSLLPICIIYQLTAMIIIIRIIRIRPYIGKAIKQQQFRELAIPSHGKIHIQNCLPLHPSSSLPSPQSSLESQTSVLVTQFPLLHTY